MTTQTDKSAELLTNTINELKKGGRFADGCGFHWIGAVLVCQKV